MTETDSPAKVGPERAEEADATKTTIIEVFGDRFKSHTLGGFVIAWLVVHWKAVFATAFVPMDELPAYDDNGNPILNKIDYFSSLNYSWCHDYVLPLFIALGVPVIAHLFDELAIKFVKKKLTDWGLEIRGNYAKAKVVPADDLRVALTTIDELRQDNESLTQKVRQFEQGKKAFEKEVADFGVTKAGYEATERTLSGQVRMLDAELQASRVAGKKLQDILKDIANLRDLAAAVNQGAVRGPLSKEEKLKSASLVQSLHRMEQEFLETIPEYRAG